MTPGSPGQPRSRPPFRPPGSPSSPPAAAQPQQPIQKSSQPGGASGSGAATTGKANDVQGLQDSASASPPHSPGRPGSGSVKGARGSHSPSRVSPRKNTGSTPPSDRFDPAQGSFYADTWVMPPRSPPHGSPARQGGTGGGGGVNKGGGATNNATASPVRIIRPDALGPPQLGQRQQQGVPGVTGVTFPHEESHLQGPQPWPAGGVMGGPRFQSLNAQSQVAQPHGVQVRNAWAGGALHSMDEISLSHRYVIMELCIQRSGCAGLALSQANDSCSY
jgi:hypothetical protein